MPQRLSAGRCPTFADYSHRRHQATTKEEALGLRRVRRTLQRRGLPFLRGYYPLEP